MDTWNPTLYERFKREREQPFADLLALIEPVRSMRIFDLGCGAGHLTRRLHDTLDAAETVGLDRSARMLDAARTAAPPDSRLRFELGTIESFAATDQYDLIFSNAALHWVDDHEGLLARLTAALRPGGQLAFQVPAMHDHASHIVAEQLTMTEPFRTAFGGWHRPQPVLPPDEYARLLFRLGFPEPRVRLVIYPHLLADRDDVIEWMKGTLLTEYEKHLAPDQFAELLEVYRQRVLARLPEERPFFFPFTRIMCCARLAA
ncbi:MAG: methyltransferase domain-containing protein [Acidobacteriota bacterium]